MPEGEPKRLRRDIESPNPTEVEARFGRCGALGL